MRVLFITAYFPPCDFGWGYMRLAESAADALHARGHTVEVLTSTYRHGPEAKPYPVHRTLELDPDWHAGRSAVLQYFLDSPRRERLAMQELETVAGSLAPEVIFIWHGHGLSRAMFRRAEGRPDSVCVYFLANYLPEMPDEYLEFWSAPGRTPAARLAKRLLKPLAEKRLLGEGRPARLAFENTISVSEHVRRRLALSGRIGPNAVTIPNGADLEALGGLHHSGAMPGRLRLIMGGRVSPEKGVHTALEALEELQRLGRLEGVTLTIVGDGPADYTRSLEDTIRSAALAQAVSMRPGIPRREYHRLLAGHDVMLFPSIWDEPLSNTMIEAMALGLLVIGTPTGGSGEILRDGETGLTFPPENSGRLAEQILRIREQPDLMETLAARGERFVRRHYTMARMLDQIEAHLLGLVAGQRAE